MAWCWLGSNGCRAVEAATGNFTGTYKIGSFSFGVEIILQAFKEQSFYISGKWFDENESKVLEKHFIRKCE